MEIKKNAVHITLAFVALALLFNLGHSIVNTYRNNTRLGKLQQDVEQSHQKIESLKKDLAYQQSDEFIEKQARNKLNFIGPGETTVVLGKRNENKSTTNMVVNIKPGNNLGKWRYLFFRF